MGLGFVSCGDDETDVAPCEETETLTIKDFSGLDGCGWVLTTPTNDSALEPTNLLTYVPNPVDGQEIKVKYKLKLDAASICLVGDIIEIECIRD
jgi:hypothetical protein